MVRCSIIGLSPGAVIVRQLRSSWTTFIIPDFFTYPLITHYRLHIRYGEFHSSSKIASGEIWIEDRAWVCQSDNTYWNVEMILTVLLILPALYHYDISVSITHYKSVASKSLPFRLWVRAIPSFHDRPADPAQIKAHTDIWIANWINVAFTISK